MHPERLIACDTMHLKREELPLGVIHRDNAHALRLNPLESQQLPVSMP